MWHATFVAPAPGGPSFTAASSTSKKLSVTRRLLVTMRLPFSTEVPLRNNAGIHFDESTGQRSTNDCLKRSLPMGSRHAFSQPSLQSAATIQAGKRNGEDALEKIGVKHGCKRR